MSEIHSYDQINCSDGDNVAFIVSSLLTSIELEVSVGNLSVIENAVLSIVVVRMFVFTFEY